MSENPFFEINERLENLEGMIKPISGFIENEKQKSVRLEKPLSVKEAAKITGLSEAFIRKMNHAPERYKDCIPFYKKMGRIYFFASELDQWMRGGNIKGKQN